MPVPMPVPMPAPMPAPPIAFAGRADQIDYRIYGEDMQFVEKDSLLCAARGVSISLFFQKNIMTALFGGEDVFLATLTGPGGIISGGRGF